MPKTKNKDSYKYTFMNDFFSVFPFRQRRERSREEVVESYKARKADPDKKAKRKSSQKSKRRNRK